MIRVLVVEDSPTVREFLLQVLRSDPGIEVVETAKTGEEALEAVERTRPDIITMDVHLPRMNGFDATRRIMETHPTPIVIVSGTTDFTDTAKAFQAIESGALAVLQKPSGVGHPNHEQNISELIRTVKVMSEVKVVRRWPRYRSAEPSPGKEIRPRIAQSQPRIIAIGASTGGPPVLQTILAGLPGNFPIPIVIVQHIAAGFTQGFVEWLAQSSSLPVHIPEHGQSVLPGQAYVAPDGLQMAVSADGLVQLRSDEPENGLRPSVACLFRSVAKAYGQSAVGVLLSGMGKDGAWELKLMKEQGALTIAQDQDTSVVHGMPGEAIKLGGATLILPPEKIYLALTSLADKAASNNDRAMANRQGTASEIDGLFLGRDLSSG
ncbi:MAG: chemotaxis-specific protein-glutamate methyltransferase CheB [Candidatus Sulfotelmatobacter sp.]